MSGIGLGIGLKQSPPFGPQKVHGLKLWLRADSGITLVSGKVSAWADQSGNGFSLTQSTAGLRPAFVASGVGARASVSFDGADDYVGLASEIVATSVLSTSAFTVFAVFNATAIDSATGFGTHDDALISISSGRFSVSLNSSPQVVTSDYDGVDFRNAPTTITTGTDIVYAGRLDAGKLYSSINGGADSAGTSSANVDISTGSPYVQIGTAQQGPNYFNGLLAELLVYNVVVASADRTRVIKYLKSRYSIA